MLARRDTEWSLPDSFELAERARRERSRVLGDMIAGVRQHVSQLTSAAKVAVRRAPAPVALPHSDAPVA